MFTDPTTIAAALLLTVSTGITDPLIHAAYPPLGPRKARPADRKAASWFWSFSSIFNGFILQAGLLSILNPPVLSLVWLGNLLSTLIIMMMLHQVIFFATDRVMFRSGIRPPFPDGKKHVHNFWTSPRFKLHLSNESLILFNAGVIVVFVFIEVMLRLFA